MAGVAKLIGSVLLGIGKSLLTEKFVKWAFIKLAEILVAKTETPHDDAFLEKIKQEVEK